MARPSVARERRAQILNAFADCIREYGLAGSSLERIAERAGVKRQIIRHYFGNRRAVADAMVELIVDETRDRYEALIATLPAGRDRRTLLLDYLFGGAFDDDLEDNVFVDELVAASHRDPELRARLLGIYRLFEDLATAELAAFYPRAPKSRCREVAHAMMCMAVSHAGMLAIGFPRKRSRAVRQAADILVDSLADS